MEAAVLGTRVSQKLKRMKQINTCVTRATGVHVRRRCPQRYTGGTVHIILFTNHSTPYCTLKSNSQSKSRLEINSTANVYSTSFNSIIEGHQKASNIPKESKINFKREGYKIMCRVAIGRN